jgi:hypothetical protein
MEDVASVLIIFEKVAHSSHSHESTDGTPTQLTNRIRQIAGNLEASGAQDQQLDIGAPVIELGKSEMQAVI